MRNDNDLRRGKNVSRNRVTRREKGVEHRILSALTSFTIELHIFDHRQSRRSKKEGAAGAGGRAFQLQPNDAGGGERARLIYTTIRASPPPPIGFIAIFAYDATGWTRECETEMSYHVPMQHKKTNVTTEKVQPADIGLPTGNGKKLSCSQAQLGQATGLAVA